MTGRLKTRAARAWSLEDSARAIFALEATRQLGRAKLERFGRSRVLTWDRLFPQDDRAGQIAAGLQTIAEAGGLPAEIGVIEADAERDYVWAGLPVPRRR